jgi:hypothetical protein
MVDLVKDELAFFRVPQPVPPIEEKSADKPTDKALCERRIPAMYLEEGQFAKDPDPEASRRERDGKLAQIDQKSTGIPTARTRQFSSWKRALGREENNCRTDHQ